MFLTFTWDFAKAIEIGPISLRFYSLLFALGFVAGYYLMKSIFKKANVPQSKLDTLLTYVVIATVVGARLGHVFFYQWDYYSQNIGEIFQVWKGGLASHGAAIAIIISVYLYAKKELKFKQSMLWMLDRLVITVALAAVFIRLGNYFNSEIYGAVGNSSFQTVFVSDSREFIEDNFADYIKEIHFVETDDEYITDSIVYPIYDLQIQFDGSAQGNAAGLENFIRRSIASNINNFSSENINILFPDGFTIIWDDAKTYLAHVQILGVPRGPTQLFEAMAYLLIFLILMWFFYNTKVRKRRGFLFGMFLVLLFGFRFFIEFLKEIQVANEATMNLNLGQQLSIPLVLIGLTMMIISKKVENE